MALTQNDMRQIEQLVRGMMRAAFGEFMAQSRISHVDESSDPCADTVVFDPETGQGEPVARLEGWGDISVPPKDAETVLLHNGFQGFEIPLSMKRWRPDGASSKAGNRGLYSSTPGARLILHGGGSGTPGRVGVNSGTPDGGAQEDVRVNDGTLKVARDTDPTESGSIAVNVTEAPGPPIVRTVAIVYTDEDGAATPLLSMVFTAGLLTATTPAAGATVIAQVKGRIKDGAAHFKG